VQATDDGGRSRTTSLAVGQRRLPESYGPRQMRVKIG